MTDGSNYLTGVGQTIHTDFNCNTNVPVFNNKTIYNLDDGGAGESTFQNDTANDYHCNAVATFAAGDNTAGTSSLFSGVAPDADLVLSSIPDTQGTYDGDDFAADLDAARGYGAIASNNSWVKDTSSSMKDATDFKPCMTIIKHRTQWMKLLDITLVVMQVFQQHKLVIGRHT